MSKVESNQSLINLFKGPFAADRSAKALRKKGFDHFLGQYYSFLSPERRSAMGAQALYRLAKSHWLFAQKRAKGQCLLRLFNPTQAEDGWVSEHTVLQVVTDDMPFLVDTVRMLLDRHGLTVHFAINAPQVMVKRDQQGVVQQYLSPKEGAQSTHQESFIYMGVDRQCVPAELKKVLSELRSNLKDVALAVTDFAAIQCKVEDEMVKLGHYESMVDEETITESRDFLQWLLDGHFIFLGARRYKKTGQGQKAALTLMPEDNLGVLRSDRKSKIVRPYSEIPSKARAIAWSPKILITMPETNTKSTVHRPVYTICIAVKHLNARGHICGEQRFIGTYTSSAYQMMLKDIPFLRIKYLKTLERAGFPHQSYASKALTHIIDTLPRDELFQLDLDELYDLSIGILRIQEHRVVRLFMRKDSYNRYYSCFVFLPRDNFNVKVMNDLKDCLMLRLGGTEVNFEMHFFETGLVRLHYIVRVDPDLDKKVTLKALQAEVIQLGGSWYDAFRASALEALGDAHGPKMVKLYDQAFSSAYQSQFSAKSAVKDVLVIENELPQQPLVVKVKTFKRDEKYMISIKVFHRDAPEPLSDLMPIMDNMGLKVVEEFPYRIEKANGEVVWINDFILPFTAARHTDPEGLSGTLEEAFYRIWLGDAACDTLNQLVVYAHLSWRQVTVMRIYVRYLRQIGFTFSQDYVADVFCRRPDLVLKLIELFDCRFKPTAISPKQRASRYSQLSKQFYTLLASVETLDEDRIFRRSYEVLDATVRTNIYQKEAGANKTYYSFKIMSGRISEMPQPVPHCEFFVYSPHRKGVHEGFEGIHIRFSQVARGGIRLSRRREDYRREVLDLAKTQQVKNAVIVPSGAKGGFVPFYNESMLDREALAYQSEHCYRDYMRGMLDLIDNVVKGKVKHPEDTLCYDGEDTYFVVAADKGTATYSDVANSISDDYDFWLGDAFASGGSEGYDHKKIGITAKGAWESVRHHFSQMQFDDAHQDFTVVGIGDMAGDVFGNGMLLSKHIRLVAAFNHMHIFIDPKPDAKKSFAERKRMFGLARSTWEDYDKQLISPGGGVFSRAAKTIPLSAAMRQLLGTDELTLPPDLLIQRLLCLPVDLLWNGGIGTYIKASTETHDDAHDRSNDAVRVNANAVRSRMIGEGGNLGMTQLARIEYELHGGHINTDFIDNSAGVDCSDHEVNIKIMLNQVVRDKQLTWSARNALLRKMTDDVSELVLRHNRQQNHSISLAVEQSQQQMDLYRRYLNFLEERQEIDRQIEFLPSDEALLEREKSHGSLTRPEISVLMAKTKNLLKDLIVRSSLVQDPVCQHLVFKAFPDVLHKKYRKQILGHKLREELIATQLANLIVDEMGLIFVYRLHEHTCHDLLHVVKAYVLCKEIFALDRVAGLMDTYSDALDLDILTPYHSKYVAFIQWASEWLLCASYVRSACQLTVQRFQSGVDEFRSNIMKYLPHDHVQIYQGEVHALVEEGVRLADAKQIASFAYLGAALKIIHFNFQFQEKTLSTVAKIYYHVLDVLKVHAVINMLDDYLIEDLWSAAVVVKLRKKLDQRLQHILEDILGAKKVRKGRDYIKHWSQLNEAAMTKWYTTLHDAQATYGKGQSQLATLTVLLDKMGKSFKKVK